MEQFDIDKIVSTEMESRRIHPSEKAWEQLDGQLEKRYRRRKVKYFSVMLTTTLIALLAGTLELGKSTENGILPTANVSSIQDNVVKKVPASTDKHSESIKRVATEDSVTENPLASLGEEHVKKMTRTTTISTAADNNTKLLDKMPEEDVSAPQLTLEVMVTQNELDSLFVAAQKSLALKEVLDSKTLETAETNVQLPIPEYEEPLDKRMYKTVKKGFVKLKAAMAN